MPELTVSLFVAGLFAIMMVALSLQVSLTRAGLKVVFGDAGDERLRRRIRAHGNYSEYAPTGLIALALLEYHVGTNGWTWTLGIVLVLTRILHAAGMLFFSSAAPRAVAMIGSHTVFMLMGGWLLYAVFA